MSFASSYLNSPRLLDYFEKYIGYSSALPLLELSYLHVCVEASKTKQGMKSRCELMENVNMILKIITK
jgi:hypothetical protein